MPEIVDPESPEGEGAEGAAALTLTPEQIRNSPEFKTLEKQNRTLARQKGTAEAAALAARTAAEEVRQAAEAQQQAALAQQISGILGDDGIAAYNEIAELSVSNPVAAAQRLAELVKANRAQSSTAGARESTGQSTAREAGAGTVANANAQSQTPPPPNLGVDGGQPLGMASTGEDEQAIIASLQKTYSDTVARNQNINTRNRVTMRDRAGAAMAYLAAAYLKAGAKPQSR